MPDYLKQGTVRVQLGDTPWVEAAGMVMTTARSWVVRCL